MIFNSLQFLLFFPIVTIIFFLLPHKFRWIHLLIASCVFYAAFLPAYILILFFTIIIDYIAGIMIEPSKGRKRKLYLVMSIIANVGILAIFKYYNFFIENVNTLLLSFNITTHKVPYLNIILPIGLSFHTFQAMSYTIEVYRRKQKAERHFGIYALYVMFYPQLVAGPIERPQNILHQFYEKKYFDYDNVTTGLKLMAWGLFKKVVIADRLSVVVNTVYANPHNYHGIPLILATLFFAFQIYCDFSGYSSIAIGSARVMGFDLMKNFDKPYLSLSISEFWKRWHISLSTWFRDYVYIPLGGNAVAEYKIMFNLLITFLISGFWHGANWTYVVWGGVNGIYLIIERFTKNRRKAIKNNFSKTKIGTISYTFICWFITFILINITWVFFRSNSIGDAFYIITHFFQNITSSLSIVLTTNLGSTKFDLFIGLISIPLLLLFEFYQSKKLSILYLKTKPIYVRWSFYILLIVSIVCLGMFDINQQFIYFQF